MISLKGFLKFLITERLGYHRPSPITDEDETIGQHVEERLDALEKAALQYLDINIELASRIRDGIKDGKAISDPHS